jgi:hypothetical protein
MNPDNDFEAKAVAASSYLDSFDFQQYTGVGPDNQALREKLYKPAVLELFWRISKPLYNLESIWTSEARNNRLSMTALGAALQETFYLQSVPVSFFDLIESTLKKYVAMKNRSVSPSEFKEYEEVITREIPKVHTLLKMRIEGLVQVVYGGFMGLEKSTSPTLRVLWNSSWFGQTWTPTVGDYDNNYFQLKFYDAALDHADRTLALLKLVGLDHTIRSQIMTSALKMKPDTKKMALSDETRTKFNSVMDHYNKFLSNLTGKTINLNEADAPAPAPTRRSSPTPAKGATGLMRRNP